MQFKITAGPPKWSADVLKECRTLLSLYWLEDRNLRILSVDSGCVSEALLLPADLSGFEERHLNRSPESEYYYRSDQVFSRSDGQIRMCLDFGTPKHVFRRHDKHIRGSN